MSSVNKIKSAIRELPPQKSPAPANWLAAIDKQAWDSEIETDFSPGGRGRGLLKKIDREIDAAKFTPLG